jgi:adenosine deaminase
MPHIMFVDFERWTGRFDPKAESLEDATNRIRAIKKADLHRHLLGSVSPKMFVRAQAGRNFSSAPRLSREQARAALVIDTPVNGLEPLFRPWRLLSKLISTPEIIKNWILGALSAAARDNVVYVELRVGSA